MIKIDHKPARCRVYSTTLDRCDNFFCHVRTKYLPAAFDIPERIHVLKQIKRILKNGGKVLIGDEIIPENILAKCLYYAFRLPMRLLTWVITQTTTNAISNFDDDVREAGMEIVNCKSFMLGMFILLEIKK